MGFETLDEDALLKWLSSRPQSACEADPDILAKYVSVLLKNEKEGDELKDMCTEQLQDFLKEETAGYVKSLFSALESGSYKEDSESIDVIEAEPQDGEDDDDDEVIDILSD